MSVPEPVFSEVTEALWERLPTTYRTQDSLGGDPWLLKRWLSGTADVAGGVAALVRRLDYYPADERDPDAPWEATSDLGDPDQADPAWLPWLGQLLGVTVDSGRPVEEQRQLVRGGASGFAAGSTKGVAATLSARLTGERRVYVYPRSVVNPDDGGGEWDLLVLTLASETPEGLDVPAELAEAKPAGVLLHHRTFESTWSEILAERPTWSQWNGATWREIEETGVD